MTILILLSSLLVVGTILRLLHRDTPPDNSNAGTVLSNDDNDRNDEPDVCCGLHEICRKTADQVGEPIYFDDEELDRFAGMDETDYTSADIEEFRDVLLTLRTEEVPLWNVSIEQRGIKLPSEVRDEMMLIMQEIAGSTAGVTTKATD